MEKGGFGSYSGKKGFPWIPYNEAECETLMASKGAFAQLQSAADHSHNVSMDSSGHIAKIQDHSEELMKRSGGQDSLAQVSANKRFEEAIDMDGSLTGKCGS